MEDLTAKTEVLVFPDLFDEYENIIKEGQVLKIYGKVSVNDDKPASLLASKIEKPDLNEAVSAPKAQAPKEEVKKKSRPGLYLKFKNEQNSVYKKAIEYTSIFEGTTPLYLYFEDTKTLKKAPSSMFVDVNDVLIRELKKLLGESNVALVNDNN